MVHTIAEWEEYKEVVAKGDDKDLAQCSDHNKDVENTHSLPGYSSWWYGARRSNLREPQ